MAKHYIRRFLLANYWSFHNIIFDFNDARTFLTGGNGAGKSTLQDAISLLYYGEDTNNLNITSATHRRVTTAIHWGHGENARRPGKTFTYIIMEAMDANGRIYHQGIRYMSKAGSDKVDETMYFWGEGTLESIHADDASVTDSGTVVVDKTRRSYNREAAFNAFFARRGYLETFRRTDAGERSPYMRFRELCRCIMDNSDADKSSLSDYVRKSIFPYTATKKNYSDLSDTLSKLDELQLMDRNNRKKEKFLQQFYDKGKGYLEAAEQYDYERKVAPYINVIYYTEAIAKADSLIAEAKRNNETYAVEKDRIRKERDDLVEKKTLIENEDDPLKRAEENLENAEMALNVAAAEYDKHCRYKNAADGITAINGVSCDAAASFEDIKKAAEVYLSECGTRQDALSKRSYDLSGLISSNDETIAMLTNDVASSASAIGPTAQMKADADRLKTLIVQEAPGADPKILYECVDDIKDAAWQDAVEGLIGNNRFGIIVPPEYYDTACTIQHRLRGNKRDSIVLNTRRHRQPLDGSVPGLLVINNEHARRYIESSYGSYVLCETDREYTSAEYALRKNGQYKVPGRSIKPGSTRKTVKVLGAAAIEKTLRSLREDNRKYEDERSAITGQIKEVSEISAQCREWVRDMCSNHDFSSDEFHAVFIAAQEKVKRAKADIKAAEGAEAVKIKKKKLKEIGHRLAANAEKEKDIDEKITKERVVMSNASDNKTTFERQLEFFSNSPYVDYIPSESEIQRAYDNNLFESLRGQANVNTRLSTLNKDVKNRLAIMNEFLSSSEEIKDRFVGLPESIKTMQDLDRVGEELDRVTEIMFEDRLRENLSRLYSSLENSYCMCLQVVYQEYEKALELRDAVNAIISKYRIGDNYYRLGPINRIADSDVDILELAKSQSGQGMQLDIRQIEAMSELCRKAFSADLNPFDYRRYITTEVQYKPVNGTVWKNADKIANDNSNGQQGILRYLFKILAFFSQVCSGDNSLNFIAADEALQGVDSINSTYFFDLLDELGVQCLMSSHLENLAEHSYLTYMFEENNGNITAFLFGKDKVKNA